MENPKNRPLTLTGAIINVVFAAINLFIMLGVCSLTSIEGVINVLDIISVFEILLDIAIIVLASILIAKWSKPVAEFKKAQGISITLFVLNCLLGVFCVANVYFGIYFSFLELLIYAMCAVFFIVDLCQNNAEYNSMDKTILSQPVKTIPTVSQVKPQKENNDFARLTKKLTDLKDMREQGIISEEEYQKLRAKVFSEYDI